jgi:hypothetical protein
MRREPVKEPPVVIPAPIVKTASHVAVKFDVERLGEVISQAVEQSKSDPVDLVGAANVLAGAINGLVQLDIEPVAQAITDLVDAVSDRADVDFSAVIKALDRNTSAVEAQTAAVKEQTAVLKMDKTVEYEKERIVRVKVG